MFENMKARYNAVRFAHGLIPTENEALGRGTTTPAVAQLERYVVWLMNYNVFDKMSPDEQDAASAKRDALYTALSLEERAQYDSWMAEELRQRRAFARFGYDPLSAARQKKNSR